MSAAPLASEYTRLKTALIPEPEEGVTETATGIELLTTGAEVVNDQIGEAAVPTEFLATTFQKYVVPLLRVPGA
jgi:hypothetical protein